MSSGAETVVEKMARTIVAEVTGAKVVRSDHPKAPAGSVDGQLIYTDGRFGALEVSTLGTQTEFELEGRLNRRGGHLPAPGDWKWIISLRDPSELDRIESIYSKVVLACEKHRVRGPEFLPSDLVLEDPDLTWLCVESTSEFFGVVIPVGAKDKSGTVNIGAFIAISSWASSELGLSAKLSQALTTDPLAKRTAKLIRVNVDERHLFLRVTPNGIAQSDFYNLVQHSVWPSEGREIVDSPRVPEGIDHIWLFTGWGQRVTRWRRGAGWDHPSFKQSTDD